jgi:tetratricopeptide (TPR) repeat protein
MTSDTTLVDASMFPRLVVEVGGRVTDEIELRLELAIGRAEDNDLTLSDPKVSRHHARLRRQGANYILSDLGSANGTRVDGVLLTADHVLEHGQRITIGDVELTYKEPCQSTQDTIAAAGPPPAIQAAQQARAGVVSAGEPIRKPFAAPRTRSKGVMVALAAVGAVVVLALLIVGILFARNGLRGQPTALSQAAESSPSAVAEASTPKATPSSAAQKTPAVTGGADAQEMSDLLAQAEALTRRGKFEEAVAIYEDLVGRAPDDARPEIGWAWVLIRDGQAGQALSHAQRAVNLAPDSSQAAAVLARAYMDNGDKAQALARAQDAVDLEAGNAEAHAVLAEALMANGQIEDAVAEADLALVQDASNADAHRIRGWLYYEADSDMGRAAGELQSAAGLEPELWSRRHDLGMLLLKAGDYNTAILAFQDALQLRPKAITYTGIGQAYYQLDQLDQARASLRQALTAGAEDVDTHALLAVVDAKQGRCEEAEEQYEQALALDASHPLALEAKNICQGEGSPSSTPSPTTEAGTGTTTNPPAQSTPSSAKPSAQPAALSGRIAFPVWDGEKGKYDTYLAQARDGSGRRLVVEEMHQPAFSPDGNWLAVNGERSDHMNLFIVKPDGSHLQEITRFIEDGLPAWAPNSTSLAFSSTRHGDKQSRVYVVDGVPFSGGRVDGRPLNFGPDDVRGEFPAWTADNRIVYQGCDVTVSPAPCGLFVMPAAPGPQAFKRLTDQPSDSAPAAYGDTIAFTSNRDGNWEIYIIDADGSGLKRLTNQASIDGLPTWSPDGKTIAFVSNRGGVWAVWAMGPDGSNQRKLFDMGGGGLASDWQHERISWGP